MKDFRNLSSWRNYSKSVKRGSDKELIKYKVDTLDYISLLEFQIMQLSERIRTLEKEIDDAR